MSACFSFLHFSSCYLILLIVVSLFHLCLSNKNIDDDDVLCLGSEKQALLQFKHGLIDEAGRLASWDDGEESYCCKWVGIGCDNITGHVHRIYLRALDGHCDDPLIEFEEVSKQRLRGNLSSSLLHLKQLRHLDLSCNDFEGIKVPKFIGSLRNLRYLNLSNSYFGGSIPPQLGNLSELHYLDMSGMDLSKAINWLQVINTIPSLVQLHLSNCQLSYIHHHVASLNLTSLSVLDLSNNNIDSSFPLWIFSITSLVSLDLTYCNFHGPIPHSIDSFRNLTSLNLFHVRGNDFMNSSLVFEGLARTIGGNLISLDISDCGVSSSALDSLHNLTSLLSLDMLDNQLTKATLGNLCNLRYLDMSRNYFSNISLTSLLESVFKCKSPHLESLILWSSGLSGSIPDSIGRLSSLRTLLLDGNLISGHIPYSIGRLSSLEMVDISHNQLNGSLPDSIGELSSLKVLHLSKNRLNGSLPRSFGQLSKLEKLSFSFNLMTGVVTETHFAKLASLNYLDGRGNNLALRPRPSNWIPPFQLQYLLLNSWSLGPQFPPWIQWQSGLRQLDISETHISSPLPEPFWRSLPNLFYLDMSQNHIQGTLSAIPATLTELYLNSNEFSGELTHISNLSLPNTLDLSNNSFSGSLHDLLCSNRVKLTNALYLGNNHFSGVIPDCWDKWPQLIFLELENNNFSGGIPTTLGSSSYLKSLNMHGNKLSGKIPASLMNLTKLVILQLGQNELVGSIPTWFGSKLSSLRILNLRSNKFYGKIPQELCYLTHIQILDLGHNKLLGNIPRCFNNFSVLSGKETIWSSQFTIVMAVVSPSDSLVSKAAIGSDSLVIKGREDTYKSILPLVMLLDLSRNNLDGHIPSELTALKKLRSLNLSRNQLTGTIPEKIGDMNILESLDLSMNKLSGELPVSLSSLNFLSSFNVSYNSLTGKVPSYTQLQSFDEWCFFNNKLCGAPLPEPCAIEPHDREDQKDEDDSHGTDLGLIISIALGFVAGFWIILAPLIFNRSWRVAYFLFLSELGYKIYDFRHKVLFQHVF